MECEICNEYFDQGTHRIVTLTTCGHSLCKSCAERIRDSLKFEKKILIQNDDKVSEAKANIVGHVQRAAPDLAPRKFCHSFFPRFPLTTTQKCPRKKHLQYQGAIQKQSDLLQHHQRLKHTKRGTAMMPSFFLYKSWTEIVHKISRNRSTKYLY